MNRHETRLLFLLDLLSADAIGSVAYVRDIVGGDYAVSYRVIDVRLATTDFATEVDEVLNGVLGLAKGAAVSVVLRKHADLVYAGNLCCRLSALTRDDNSHWICTHCLVGTLVNH